MLTVDLFDETDQLDEQIKTDIRSLLLHAAKEEKLEQHAELSVTFVDNERIRHVNAEYRGIDKPTDVISFALEDEVEGEVHVIGAPEHRILGDIIISVDRAKEQAEDYGHTFMRELGFLAVHGFLHLLGYDHMEEDEERIMFQRQKDILESFGLKRS